MHKHSDCNNLSLLLMYKTASLYCPLFIKAERERYEPCLNSCILPNVLKVIKRIFNIKNGKAMEIDSFSVLYMTMVINFKTFQLFHVTLLYVCFYLHMEIKIHNEPSLRQATIIQG